MSPVPNIFEENGNKSLITSIEKTKHGLHFEKNHNNELLTNSFATI